MKEMQATSSRLQTIKKKKEPPSKSKQLIGGFYSFKIQEVIFSPK